MLAPSPPRHEIELLSRMAGQIGDIVYVPRKFWKTMRTRGFMLTDGLSGPSDWAVLMTYVGKPENARSNKSRANEGRRCRSAWSEFATRESMEAAR